MQMLAEFFEVAKQESLVLFDGPAQGSAKLIALEARRGISVEEIARVERIVSQKFKDRPM